MRIVIGCVDGIAYYGDVHSETEVMAEVEKAGNYFGQDVKGNDLYAYTIEDVIEHTQDFIELHNDWNVQTITLIINGRERKFNARHIVWWEIRRDENE